MAVGVLISWLAAGAWGGQHGWEALAEPSGWRQVATRSTDVGEIRVLHRRIDDADCIQGVMHTDAPLARLAEVVDDVPSAVHWNTAGLTVSEVVGAGDGWMDVHQYMPIPDWTLVADRWWVLRGRSVAAPDGGARFRWERVVTAEVYPELHRRLEEAGGALEIEVNWGEWVFEPAPGGLEVSYRVCTDIGGALPRWIQRMASQRTLPNTIVDLVREARRREAAAIAAGGPR